MGMELEIRSRKIKIGSDYKLQGLLKHFGDRTTENIFSKLRINNTFGNILFCFFLNTFCLFPR